MTENTLPDQIYYEAHRDVAVNIMAGEPDSLNVIPYPHYHRCMEIIFVVLGSVSVEIDGCETVSAYPGEFVVIEETVLHRVCDSRPGKFVLMQLPKQYLGALNGLLGENRLGANVCQDDPRGLLSASLHSLCDAVLRKPRAPDRYVMALAEALTCGIYSAVGSRPKRNSRTEAIIPVIEYVAEHLVEPLTVKDLARQFGYTPRGLTAAFKASSHVSLKQYIAEARLRESKKKLREGGTLEEAAEAGGYSCLRSLHRAFERSGSATPGEYRGRYNK